MALAVGATGVVFGDIGTSPLYAMRQCLSANGLPADPDSVLGVASLIFWALTMVVSVKYLMFIMRADNHALGTLTSNGVHGFLLLGSVILAVTGAEALYADMGHFGDRPIRRAWFALVKPALVLAYFGQAAAVLADPAAAANPLYALAPSHAWALIMFTLATLATIIASQALISGVFSLTRQAVQLVYFPRGLGGSAPSVRPAHSVLGIPRSRAGGSTHPRSTPRRSSVSTIH